MSNTGTNVSQRLNCTTMPIYTSPINVLNKEVHVLMSLYKPILMKVKSVVYLVGDSLKMQTK